MGFNKENSISIIICSWQAPPTLDETLDSVFQQENAPDFEVILVNNGFSGARADQLQATHPKLRILDEPTPGLAHARCTGFRAALGDFFVCIDDDNFLEIDFIRTLAGLVSKYPNLGCISPVVLPRWEQEPSEWLKKFGQGCLSYNSLEMPGPDRKEIFWRHPNFTGWRCPSGGGMIIHRSVAEKYLGSIEEKRLKLGRIRSSLGGCEDVDILYRLPFVERDAVFTPNLVLYHQIPKSRLQMKYLFRLAFRSTQDWAVFQRLLKRDNHPLASNNSLFHFCEFFRVPYAGLRIFIRTRKPQPQILLEWASHAGYVWGYACDVCKSFFSNLLKPHLKN
jgi:glycosyltransferase involved in cell wall biosynthesis